MRSKKTSTKYQRVHKKILGKEIPYGKDEKDSIRQLAELLLKFYDRYFDEQKANPWKNIPLKVLNNRKGVIQYAKTKI